MSEQVSNIIKQAHLAWEGWNQFDCTIRAEIIASWSDMTDQHPRFDLMSAQMAKYQIKQGLAFIAAEKLMPGPTGESNELYASGRGVFVIHSSDDTPLTAIVGMLSTALLAGNCILLALPDSYFELAKNMQSALNAAGVPNGVIQVVSCHCIEQLICDTSIAGVAYAGEHSESLKLNKQLAQRQGLLAQFIVETQLTSLNTITDPCFVLRFITEKTRTINVTAVGGNALLLELGCGD